MGDNVGLMIQNAKNISLCIYNVLGLIYYILIYRNGNLWQFA